MSLCPHCGSEIAEVHAQALPIASGQRQFAGIAYACPQNACRKIIGIEFDPLRLAAITVQRVSRGPGPKKGGLAGPPGSGGNGSAHSQFDVASLARTSVEEEPTLF